MSRVHIRFKEQLGDATRQVVYEVETIDGYLIEELLPNTVRPVPEALRLGRVMVDRLSKQYRWERDEAIIDQFANPEVFKDPLVTLGTAGVTGRIGTAHALQIHRHALAIAGESKVPGSN